ncbi:phage portal protein [Mycobacteroides sp. PCS013]|uniref:phage portal protein n=1 Tax=Mycobacteroides sp. PCS013 TaxID=3074106 RepID=UPI003C2AE894
MTLATPDSPVVAIALPSLKLGESERDAARALRAKLNRVNVKNRQKSALYEAKHAAEDLGIAAPEGLSDLVRAVAGWPGTVVDVLEERLDFLGWTGADQLALQDVMVDNDLEVESGRGHLDTLICGAGFVAAGKGDESAGEPEILVTVESSESCTVEWDYRLRRARSGYSQTRDENGVPIMETLYLPNETINFERVRGELVATRRDPHKLNRVPLAQLVNRERASDIHGRSEISRAVAYYTDACIRTLLGMEINREFYTSPKWTALNTDPEVFGMGEGKTPQENRRAGWSSTAGRMNAIPPQVNEEGDIVEPRLHEFRPAPPTPYIDQIRCYSQLLAAEAGIPAPYLGFVTDNPNSADSIRQQEYRLVKRAERRQTSFSLAWREIAYLALLLRDGSVDPVVFREVSPKWRDAATPTRAAASDEVMKYISSGVLKPDSPVAWDRAGFSQQDQRQMERDNRRASVTDLTAILRARQQPQQGE